MATESDKMSAGSVNECGLSGEMLPRKITDLPLEILSEILSLLPFCPDFLNVRLVCKMLYTASLDVRFVDRERVVFGNELYPVEFENLLKSHRPFMHFRFLNESAFSPSADLWSRFGPYLKSLTLHECEFTEDELFLVLSHCTRLKALVISTCCVEINSNTAAEPLDNLSDQIFLDSSWQLNLESFVVRDQLDPRIFHRLLKHSPHLKFLSVEGFKGVHSLSSGESGYSIRAHISVDAIFAYLCVCGHRLKGLQLILDDMKPWHQTGARNRLAAALSQTDVLRLRKFSTNVKVEKDFFVRQKNTLEELILGDVPVDVLAVICRELHNLQHLDVTTTLRTASDAKNFTLRKKLSSLRISLHYGPAIIENDVFTGLCGNELSTLKVLELRHTVDKVFVSPDCISSLAQTFSSLVNLNLYACDGVSESSMQSIFRYLVGLESLELCQCRNLTDAALYIDSEGAQNQETYYINRLKRLRMLDVSCCMKLSGEAFNSKLSLPDLRELNLSYNKISRESLVRISENHPAIESLSLDGCIALTDDLVSILVSNLSRLRYVVIGFRSNISEEGLKVLRGRCRRVYNSEPSGDRPLRPFLFMNTFPL